MEDDVLMSFMSITGETDVESANHYLEAAGFDLQTAIELFFSNQPASRTTTSTKKPTTSDSDFSAYDDIRSPIPQQASRLYDFPHSGSDNYNTNYNTNYNMPSFVNDHFSNFRTNQQFQQSKLTGQSEEFSEMFKKPEIVFQGTFEAAKQEAEMNAKWLLVDIQKDDVFHCHQMNRDTWGNDLVKTLVSTFFVLWQADEGTTQGQYFKSRYPVYSYPYVCVIDPRTGENVKQWTGKFIDAPTMIDSLQNFVDSHSLMDHLPSPSPSTLHAPNPFETLPYASNPSENQGSMMDDSEEEMVRAAIEASLKETQGMNDEDEVQEVPNPALVTPTTAVTNQQPEPPKPVETPDMKINIADFVCDQGDTTRIQIRLPDGKREVIKILKKAPLAAIYAVCRQKLEGSGISSFTVTYFDKTQKTVENVLDKTLADEGIIGVSLSVVQE